MADAVVGPHGMTTPECEMQLWVGGLFRTLMRAPDGSEYPTQGVFLEIAAPRRLVFTDAFGPGWVPSDKAFMTAVISFDEEHGKTRYTARAWHWNAADSRAHEEMGFHRGWGEPGPPGGGRDPADAGLMSGQAQVRAEVEAVYRRDSRRILATLIRLLGDFDLAEEALHDAFFVAVERWQRDGIPDNPRAWLVSTGRFKAIDALRRRARFDRSQADLIMLIEGQGSTPVKRNCWPMTACG